MGTVSGNATFNSTSSNTACSFCNPGTISGDAIFNDTSFNKSSVLSNATFNNSSYNSKNISGNATFNDGSINYGTVSKNASFFDLTINQNAVTGNACFATTATNNGRVRGTTSACSVVIPTVTSTSVDLQSVSSVNFTGTITNIGGETINTVGFQYGFDTSYGNTISNTGTFNREAFSKVADSLSACGEYHFRAFATNSAGTSYGEDVSFIVTPCKHSGGRGRIPAPATTITGTNIVCKPGELFNTITGLPCTSYEPLPTPATSTCLFTLTLMQGNTGEDVKCLQEGLNARVNTNLVIDGIFGNKTKAAVIKFQLANHLRGDGIFGILSRVAWNK